jgi:NADH-quinone oxidoreductase subunit N
MNFNLILPELLTALLAFTVLILSLIIPKGKRGALLYLTISGLVIILVFLYGMMGINDTFLNGMFLIDGLATYFKFIIIISALFVTVLSLEYGNKHLAHVLGEYNVTLLFAVLGMMVLVSAGDLVTLYTALELMTLSFISLVGYGGLMKKAPEAAIKYILLSALSSAVLLYGLTLTYGIARSTMLVEIARQINEGAGGQVLLLAVIFVVSALAFKVSAVPFHMWTPDVYEGAPTPVTAFLSVASKGAAFAILLRLLLQIYGSSQLWLLVLMVITTLTLILGNYVAIPQTNIKRLMAYSGIAQAGYILLGVIAYSRTGLEAAIFYCMLYVFSNLGAFAVIIVMSNQLDSEEIADYAGLWKRSPLMAATMLICLLSLAGIPPLAGFYGKFYLFTAVMEQGYTWLVFVALAMSMVSVYYYLMVAKVMYLYEPGEGGPIRVSLPQKLSMLVAMVVTLFLGVYPEPLTELAVSVAKALMP